jgi:hypothetical protein
VAEPAISPPRADQAQEDETRLKEVVQPGGNRRGSSGKHGSLTSTRCGVNPKVTGASRYQSDLTPKLPCRCQTDRLALIAPLLLLFALTVVTLTGFDPLTLVALTGLDPLTFMALGSLLVGFDVFFCGVFLICGAFRPLVFINHWSRKSSLISPTA